VSLCASCGADLSGGWWYCDNVCKQAAYRDRKQFGDRWEEPQFVAERRRNRDRRYRTALFERWERHGFAPDGEIAAALHGGARWADVEELFGRFATEREMEALLRDDRIRKLLLKALVTDSEEEASAALAIARRLHRNGVTRKRR
jgi:hypothetical protein